jgi:hypothetical protein
MGREKQVEKKDKRNLPGDGLSSGGVEDFEKRARELLPDDMGVEEVLARWVARSARKDMHELFELMDKQYNYIYQSLRRRSFDYAAIEANRAVFGGVLQAHRFNPVLDEIDFLEGILDDEMNPLPQAVANTMRFRVKVLKKEV